MMAQKRTREGIEEVEWKWWSTTPRWGGGPGGELGTSDDKVIEESGSSNGPPKRTNKPSKAELWRAMLPPRSTWDKNITYLQVGKDGARLCGRNYLLWHWWSLCRYILLDTIQNYASNCWYLFYL